MGRKLTLFAVSKDLLDQDRVVVLGIPSPSIIRLEAMVIAQPFGFLPNRVRPDHQQELRRQITALQKPSDRKPAFHLTSFAG
jgi:hypothetical protein